MLIAKLAPGGFTIVSLSPHRRVAAFRIGDGDYVVKSFESGFESSFVPGEGTLFMEDMGPVPLYGGKVAPLYVSRPVTNAVHLVDWFDRQDMPNLMKPEDLHVTVLYSKEPMIWDMPDEADPIMSVPTQHDRTVERLGDKGALVLRFNSPQLTKRHMHFRRHGGSSDYPSYVPHVSLSWNADGYDESRALPFPFPIHFGAEKFADIDPDWKPT